MGLRREGGESVRPFDLGKAVAIAVFYADRLGLSDGAAAPQAIARVARRVAVPHDQTPAAERDPCPMRSTSEMH